MKNNTIIRALLSPMFVYILSALSLTLIPSIITLILIPIFIRLTFKLRNKLLKSYLTSLSDKKRLQIECKNIASIHYIITILFLHDPLYDCQFCTPFNYVGPYLYILLTYIINTQLIKILISLKKESFSTIKFKILVGILTFAIGILLAILVLPYMSYSGSHEAINEISTSPPFYILYINDFIKRIYQFISF
ncbi:MAG: hypothetical protein N4A47_00080 [Clostridia bacterium]|jgi:hypothetical protein|nr:hypothetical protein [Clostridia bacterium]